MALTKQDDRDGKQTIFSVSKAVCVERKWVHSASIMVITRLHISPRLAFLEADNLRCKLLDLLLHILTKQQRDTDRPDLVLGRNVCIKWCNETLQAEPHRASDVDIE